VALANMFPNFGVIPITMFVLQFASCEETSLMDTCPGMLIHFILTIETETMFFATIMAGGMRAPSLQSYAASIPCVFVASCTGSGNVTHMSLEHGAVFEISLATTALLPCQIEIDPGAFDRDACRVVADSACGN
jgi:hypothetical protein